MTLVKRISFKSKFEYNCGNKGRQKILVVHDKLKCDSCTDLSILQNNYKQLQRGIHVFDVLLQANFIRWDKLSKFNSTKNIHVVAS